MCPAQEWPWGSVGRALQGARWPTPGPTSPVASPQGFGQARNWVGPQKLTALQKPLSRAAPGKWGDLTLRVPCQGIWGQVSQEPEGTGEEPPGLKVQEPPRWARNRAQPRRGARSPRPGLYGA